jgi:hypothetical protein
MHGPLPIEIVFDEAETVHGTAAKDPYSFYRL